MNARKGFTLVETIATMTVLAALGTVLSFMIGGAAASYADAATRSELSVALSVALDHIDRELRNIELDSGASVPAPNIDLVEPERIEWSGDWSLSRSGSNLEIVRGGAPSAVLMSDVTSLTIQAFDESNTALASSLSGSACDPIRRLSVEITVQRAGTAETLRSKVFIRSLTTGAGS